MLDRPFFSFVLPVYNVGELSEECVASCVEQEFTDCEIILVDDGSTDNSGEICDELSRAYARVTTVHKTNGGLADARNYGMDRASGRYILFIDSDDWVDREMMPFLYDKLKGSDFDIFKYAYRKHTDGKNSEVIHSCFPEGVYEREEIERTLLPAAIGPVELFNYKINPLNSAWINAYSLDFLRRNDLRFVSEREILNEDYLFTVSTLLFAEKVGISHKPLYYYRYREGSLSKSYIYKEVERRTKLHEAYKTLLTEHGVWERYETAYYSACVDGFYGCFTNECSKWNPDSENAVQNIRKILSRSDCREAVRKCKKPLGYPKGFVLYCLMRARAAALMYYLYGLIV